VKHFFGKENLFLQRMIVHTKSSLNETVKDISTQIDLLPAVKEYRMPKVDGFAHS
jgi:hypothetical protein